MAFGKAGRSGTLRIKRLIGRIGTGRKFVLVFELRLMDEGDELRPFEARDKFGRKLTQGGIRWLD